MNNLHFENLTFAFCNKVFDIEAASIEEPWSLSQIQGLVEDKNAIARVGLVDDVVVCYYSFYNICGEANINNLAVCEIYRGKGIGRLMLEDMLNIAKRDNITDLTLEVNVNNSVAISLYEKFGFKIEGRRIKFYCGKDDALIMWKRNI